jgi:hypothetical protein
MTIATVLAALTVFVCGLILIGMVRAANRVGNVTDVVTRPYLAFGEELTFEDAAETAVVVTFLKNTGNSPAVICDKKLLILLDGLPAGRLTDSIEGVSLDPGRGTWFVFRLRGRQTCDSIMAGRMKLELMTEVTYRGVGKQNQYLCQHDMFEPTTGGFLSIRRDVRKGFRIAELLATGSRAAAEVSFDRPCLSDGKTSAVIMSSRVAG